MTIRKWAMVVALVAAFAGGFWLHDTISPAVTVHAAANRVFELRTYTTPPGKLDALKARFRDHTITLFNKHQMTSVGYWTPQDAPTKDNTLIYVLAHPSREEATKNWAAFRADPDWVKAKADSEKDGPLTTKTESVFMDPTDFSQIK